MPRPFWPVPLFVALGSAGYLVAGGPASFAAASEASVPAAVAPAALAAWVLTSLAVATVQVASHGVAPVPALVANLRRGLRPAAGLTMLALVAVALAGSAAGPLALVLLLLPLYVVRWSAAQHVEASRAREAAVAALVRAIEVKDGYTGGHSERVALSAVLIARELRMPEHRVARLRHAGALHDLGKLAVPTAVITKPGRLDAAEWELLLRHPGDGADLVAGIDFLGEAARGIRHHHERLDGGGYPAGLAGRAVPEFGRVIAVADAYDAMTTSRSYRAARSPHEALAELRRCAGTQFDARVVEALARALRRPGAPAALVTPVAETLPAGAA